MYGIKATITYTLSGASGAVIANNKPLPMFSIFVTVKRLPSRNFKRPLVGQKIYIFPRFRRPTQFHGKIIVGFGTFKKPLNTKV